MEQNIAQQPTLGKRIRERRLALGLSQTELAARVPMTPAALHRIERGRTRRPQAAIAAALARELGLDVSEVRGPLIRPSEQDAALVA